MTTVEPIRLPKVPTSRCECDYDYDYEAQRHIKTSSNCPEHDECDECGNNMGSVRLGGDWLCTTCATCECEAPAVCVVEDAIRCAQCAAKDKREEFAFGPATGYMYAVVDGVVAARILETRGAKRYEKACEQFATRLEVWLECANGARLVTRYLPMPEGL